MAESQASRNEREDALVIHFRVGPDGEAAVSHVEMRGALARIRVTLPPNLAPALVFSKAMVREVDELLETAADNPGIISLMDYEMEIGPVRLTHAVLATAGSRNGDETVMVRFRGCEGEAFSLFLNGVLPKAVSNNADNHNHIIGVLHDVIMSLINLGRYLSEQELHDRDVDVGNSLAMLRSVQHHIATIEDFYFSHIDESRGRFALAHEGPLGLTKAIDQFWSDDRALARAAHPIARPQYQS